MECRRSEQSFERMPAFGDGVQMTDVGLATWNSEFHSYLSSPLSLTMFDKKDINGVEKYVKPALSASQHLSNSEYAF